MTLTFTQAADGSYVSSEFQGGEKGIATVHINYSASPADVFVERKLDGCEGWAVAAKRQANIGSQTENAYEETICGIPTDVSVRIRTNFQPTSGTVVTE